MMGKDHEKGKEPLEQQLLRSALKGLTVSLILVLFRIIELIIN